MAAPRRHERRSAAARVKRHAAAGKDLAASFARIDLATLFAIIDAQHKALEPFADTASVDIGKNEADEDFFRQGNREYMKARPLVIGDLCEAHRARALIAPKAEG